jgi:membrane fusion protein, heavy metal efflux system
VRGARIGPVTLAVVLAVGVAGCAKESGSPARTEASAHLADAGAAPAATAEAGEVKLCEHKVPADLCTRCNPDLIPVFQAQDDWCEEHGVPESQCFQCNPKLSFTAPAAPPADWCKEHAVPESKCTKCNPRLVAKFIEAGDFCREHGFPMSVCPIHHPELAKAAGQPPPSEVAPTTRVRLASADTAQEAGIRTVQVQKRRFGRTLEVVGQLDFNQNRLVQLSARGDALVQEVKVDVGDEVKAGQSLVVLTSAAVGEGQAQLSAASARVSAARAAVERERGLVAKGISPKKDLEDAEADLAAAQGELEAARSSLGAAGATSSGSGGRYVLAAPFAGTVVARNATAGRSASPGEVLIQVADLSTMWAQLEVPEADAGLVRPGLPVGLILEGMGGKHLEATITRVAPSVDPQTRTMRARVELPNPEKNLKAGVFLKAKVQVAPDHDALLVPRDAIQQAEGKTLVFVKQETGLYRPVPVEVGASTSDAVEVVKGLSPGAEVVTTGAFLLKTEILKESIGAGCCEEGE